MRSGEIVVVKIGSSVLAPGGRMDHTRLIGIAEQIALAKDTGFHVVLVSSGAIAAGFRDLGLEEMPSSIVMRQAAAAAGQTRLMNAWAAAMEPHDLRPAQVLLTADLLEKRDQFLNTRRQLELLLSVGVVPVINENDSVSFADTRFGDNDRLGALVASLLDAEHLVILSVVDGLLDENGEVLEEVTDHAAARALVSDDRSGTGVGGMGVKISAAALAADAGVSVSISSGLRQGFLEDLLAGKNIGTRFGRSGGKSARKRWIGHARTAQGTVVVDAGAKQALVNDGASLLPAGVVGVRGDFGVGAAVDVCVADGEPFARGLAAYSSADIRKIAGLKSDRIEQVLGVVYTEEVIHRDDLHVSGEDAR
ncbi:MAG: glutamate 5-kinase [Phycisphaera sp.]|nr:MAG: glutamate 5-kinase [Phycisphaera sp.]